MGALRTVEIFCRVYRSGWVVLVHHFDTVTGSLPNCSASHLPVCPVSASTAFILLILCRSAFASITNKLISNTNLLIYNTIIPAQKHVLKHKAAQVTHQMALIIAELYIHLDNKGLYLVKIS